MRVCLCTCTDQKMSHHTTGSCRVCSVGKRERQRKRMWGTSGLPVLLVTPSLFSAFTSLSPPFFFSLPPSTSFLLHFYLFSGGVWTHHGQLGLRSSHNDWRTVHLQPQGGGPYLPGLPRWHWVRFTGSKAAANVAKKFFGGGQVDRLGLTPKGWERIISLLHS